jgi:hypothetical protein
MKLSWGVVTSIVWMTLSSNICVAQQTRDPQPRAYDASKLSQYSYTELMDFLSAPSFERTSTEVACTARCRQTGARNRRRQASAEIMFSRLEPTITHSILHQA